MKNILLRQMELAEEARKVVRCQWICIKVLLVIIVVSVLWGVI